MFIGAIKFNKDIGNWKTLNVKNMDAMFYYALEFNQDISRWDVSRVIGMDQMFTYEIAFNYDISDWDITCRTKTTEMFHMADYKFTNIRKMFRRKYSIYSYSR